MRKWYRMSGAVREAHGAAGGGGAAVGVITRRRVDIVLINVAKLLIHGITIQ